MGKIILKGITWGHSRGITPLLALAQRYNELHSEVEIQWQKRTLQEFADYPVEELAKHYDLLIIDHPSVGRMAATGCLLALDEHLPEPYLKDQLTHSVGYSHLSYNYENHQWALAVDAATPAASYRKDMLETNGIPVPTTWEEVLALAQRGKVAVPAIPIDLLMNLYTFCIAHGKEPFANDTAITDCDTGLRAMATMKELYALVDKKMFSCNPIAVAELMTTTDDYWYCPFAYCYSNYSREGYARKLLHYTNVVQYNGQLLRTTIGGTGLAVSAHCRHPRAALDFAALVASPECQRTMYVQHGGQPGHKLAWLDEAANRLTNNFFKELLPVMDNGYVRPRYDGYLDFQERAGIPLWEYLQDKKSAENAWEEMNRLYRESRKFISKQEMLTAATGNGQQ